MFVSVHYLFMSLSSLIFFTGSSVSLDVSIVFQVADSRKGRGWGLGGGGGGGRYAPSPPHLLYICDSYKSSHYHQLCTNFLLALLVQEKIKILYAGSAEVGRI